MITFTRLRDGGWGLRGPKHELIKGEEVRVQRKDGSFTSIRVGSIIWSGNDTPGEEDTTIAYIEGNEPDPGPKQQPDPRTEGPEGFPGPELKRNKKIFAGRRQTPKDKEPTKPKEPPPNDQQSNQPDPFGDEIPF